MGSHINNGGAKHTPEDIKLLLPSRHSRGISQRIRQKDSFGVQIFRAAIPDDRVLQRACLRRGETRKNDQNTS